jgi:hypothetical protein
MMLLLPDPYISRLCAVQEPFVGKDAIRTYFTKVKSILGPTLLFVVENVSGGDSTAVGVKW